MNLVYAYILHFLSGLVLLAVFFVIYTKITPFHEVALVRQGNRAAALSLSGAMIGYSLTIASSIAHNDTFITFLYWGTAALAVQAMCYAIMARVLPDMNDAIAGNNIAMGGLMGLAALVVGLLNAACLT